eukprot:5839784-Lingulodinium_polyedra.AAC.1
MVLPLDWRPRLCDLGLGDGSPGRRGLGGGHAVVRAGDGAVHPEGGGAHHVDGRVGRGGMGSPAAAARP